jgi:hypothetical protein
MLEDEMARGPAAIPGIIRNGYYPNVWDDG